MCLSYNDCPGVAMNYNMYRTSYCQCTLTLILIWLILAADTAFSQVLEEVVVTAQKKEQNLQDVGLSVTAFSGEQISKLGFKDTLEIVQQTPGLNVSAFHKSLPNINIRGVSQSDFADQLEAPVAVYSDGVYLSNQGLSSAQVFDLERIEVLRGPQGTLFGRNATGGLLHYISKRPSEEFDAYTEITAGEYGLFKIEGAVGGAISDGVAGRISLSRHVDDGYLENRTGPDLLDNDVWSVRGQLLVDLSDKFEMLLKAHWSEDDTNGHGYSHQAAFFDADGLAQFVPDNVDIYGSCPGCDPLGYRDTDGDPWTESHGNEGLTSNPPQPDYGMPGGLRPLFEREVKGITANLSYEFDSMTLTSITDYLEMDKLFRSDSDGSPRFGAFYGSFTELEQFSQELRLSGETDKMSWIAGIYYLDFETDQNVYAPNNFSGFAGDPNGVFLYSVATSAIIESRSVAVFGHVDRTLTDTLSLIASIRYTDDSREINDHINEDPDQGFGPIPPVSINASFPELTEQDYENVSAKLELDWRPNDNTLLFASFTRGHKAGNFALPLGAFFGGPAGLATMPHDEEVLHSYEIGGKWTSSNGKARVNASAFYYDYQDYQASFFVGLTQIIDNIDAESYGGEIELTLNPIEGLEILLGVSTIQSKSDEINRTATLPATKQTLPYSPDISINGLARYTWPLFNGNFSLQADFNHTDNFCFTLICHPVEQESSYTVANLRASYTSQNEDWSVTAFVNNVTDAEYRQYGLNLVSVTGTVTNLFTPPRWSGATLRYNWR